MKLTMLISPNQGYGPDQVEGLTLADLRELVNEAIDEHGEDAEVVTYDSGNRYGAKYGTFGARYGTLGVYDLFAPADEEGDS